MTTAISYEQSQMNWNAARHQISQTHEPVIIERLGEENLVLLSQKDYLSLLEHVDFLKFSESLLKNIWDNEDDADYDKL
jgi:PHD/YefM family antitoxin component YafN of YafNO toxin-antitoxin module